MLKRLYSTFSVILFFFLSTTIVKAELQIPNKEILPAEVIKLIEEKKISQGHGKIIVGLENSYQIAKKIIEKKLSVRQAENLVRIYKSTKKFKVITNDSNIKSLENSLQEKTGLNAKIHHKKNNKGILSFEYNNTDQLDRLVMVIKANY